VEPPCLQFFSKQDSPILRGRLENAQLLSNVWPRIVLKFLVLEFLLFLYIIMDFVFLSPETKCTSNDKKCDKQGHFNRIHVCWCHPSTQRPLSRISSSRYIEHVFGQPQCTAEICMPSRGGRGVHRATNIIPGCAKAQL
jgi:hypothetical protein